MKLKRFLMIFSILMGCDTSEDFISNRNSEPVIRIETSNGNGFFVQDSLKISDQNSFFVKQVTLIYSDENNNVSQVHIESTTEDVYIIQEDTILVDQALVLATGKVDTIQLELLSFKEGIKQLQFRVEDSFHQSKEASLELLVFRNLVPIVIETHQINTTDQLITFDLTSSYDPDEQFGGRVTDYELSFNGETFTRRSDGIFIVVYTDSQTIYDYSVRVRDNNGDFSAFKASRININ